MHILIAFLLVWSMTTDTRADALRVITTPGGAEVLPYAGEIGPVRPHNLDDPEVAWSRNVAAAIFYSTAVTTQDYAYSGSSLNAPREAAQYELLGTGIPIHSIEGHDWAVAAAPHGGYWAAVNRDGENNLVLHLLANSMPTPLWSCSLGSGAVASNNGLQFSESDDVLAVYVTRSPAQTPRLMMWNLTEPDSIPELDYSFPPDSGMYARTLALSADGSVVAATADQYCHVIEMQGPVSRGILNFGASADGLALSADGNYLMGAFQTVKLFHWDGTSYNMQWQMGMGGSRYCSQLLISPDNTYCVSLWYPLTYNRNYVYVHDLQTGYALWTYTYNLGSGLQDWPVDADISADGNWFVVGSWGDQGSQNGEAVVFSRYYPTPYYELDMAGSLFSLDLSSDGRYLIAGGKHVHANEFGNGGDLYLVELDLPPEAPIPGVLDPGLHGPPLMCNCQENGNLSVSIFNRGYAPLIADSITWSRFADYDNSTLLFADSTLFHSGIAPGDTLQLDFAFLVCDANFDELGTQTFHFYVHAGGDTVLDLPFLTLLEWCSGANDQAGPVAASFGLCAYPNPFNASSTIVFSLPEAAELRLAVLDILGREVQVLTSGPRTAGTHEITWNPHDLPSGIYFANLSSRSGTLTSKILLLR